MNPNGQETGAEGETSARLPQRYLRLSLPLLVALGVVAVIFAVYKTMELTWQSSLDTRFVPRHRVNLEERDSPSTSPKFGEGPRKLPLRVAVAPVISPETSLPLYQGLVDYLADALGREAVLLQRSTYGETNDLVRYGRCDIAFVCTYPFVQGERDFGMQVLAVPQIGGKITYHSYIIVPASSDAESLLDLRTKRFASADILSNSGWLFPATWLRNHGEHPEHFFSKHVITGSHDRSVRAVATRYVDGAAVDSLVYDQMADEDPSLRAKTRIILKSPPFGMPPVVVHPGTDPALKGQLLEVLLRMSDDLHGVKALSPLRIDRFVVPDEGLYDSVREASAALESY